MESIQEFESYINKIEGHWLWIGALRKGYGILKFRGKTRQATRVARYFYCNFDLDDNRLILHKNSCHLRNCINPDHTYIGDESDNTNDSVDIGTHNNASKTHCKNGHEFTKKNTYDILRKGIYVGRECRICRNNHYKPVIERR